MVSGVGFMRKNFPSEDNFYGNSAILRAATAAIEGGGCGLYKRALRIRKHIFLRSMEGPVRRHVRRVYTELSVQRG